MIWEIILKYGLLLVIALCAGFPALAAEGEHGDSVPSLDPANRDYMKSFCTYHSASPICIIKPSPPVRPVPPDDSDPVPHDIPVPPPPPPARCQGGGKVTEVASAAQFQSVLGSANGGDTIILKAGTYGTLNVNKGGSGAGAPIYIAAENPAVNASAQPQTGARSSVGLMTINAGNVTVCGIYFNDTSYKSIRHDKRADNMTYLQNYFNTGVHNAMAVEEAVDTWEGGTNLTLQSNYFNATRNSSFAQDYGLAAFQYNGLYVRGNVFDGVFNHAVSLKWGVNNALIDGNVFRGCGQVCVEIGQTQDFTGSENNTGMNAVVSNNIIIGAYKTHPQARYNKGVLLRNQQNITVTGNTFQGEFDTTIMADFMNRGGLERLADRKLGVWNLKQSSIRIENNKFSNSKLNFTGRGTGAADHITLSGNTGTFTCKVGPLVEAAGKAYAWETIDRAAPTVTGCR